MSDCHLWRKGPVRRLGHLALVAAVGAIVLPAPAAAQRLNENCIVSVLNRNTRVRPDGTWVLPNIPANFGPVRARATCIFDGETVSGESAPFEVPPNGSVNVPRILLGPTTPIPQSLQLTVPASELTQIGQTTQLTVIARYADAPDRNVSDVATGTKYVISNPRIATITASGLISALASGTALIQASNEGTSAFTSVRIVLSADSDGDGIPDDLELSLGLNPNNPADAFEDPDRDGASNRDEALAGTGLRDADSDDDGLLDGEELRPGADGFLTNPLSHDTDGDGVRDALEVSTGSDPTNAASVNLGAALQALSVAPGTFTITVNSIVGVGSLQLSVTGLLRDGHTVNLTSTQRGTNYASSDLNVCNFGSPDGRVFGSSNGPCTITITNSGFTATASGSVTNFTPTALGTIPIPGYANNVDANGGMAYVAAGAAGLVVVDATSPTTPSIISTLDTPGNANDVRVIGTRAYVADGPSGLRIIDVSNPAAPAALGAVDTPGEANDVIVAGNFAYVADGDAGVQIVDITLPASPLLVRTVNTPGIARGVDVEGNVLVVADDSPAAGLRVIDITNPQAASIVGNLSLSGNAIDLDVANGVAVVAAFAGGTHLIDVSVPSNPVALSNIPGSGLNGFVPRDVQIAGRFALFAEQLFTNAVAPIVDISNPSQPFFRGVVDFGQDFAGTGIAVSGPYVYWTGPSFVVSAENGTTGNTRLFIGQYIAIEDRAGVAPAVTLTAPPEGTSAVEGSQVVARADATDDVGVASVTFTINGATAFTDTSEPFEARLTVPPVPGPMVIGASALDFGGNVAVAAPVSVTVIPDPLTTVSGTVVRGGTLEGLAGATVTCAGRTTTTGAGGVYSISGIPTIGGGIRCSATLIEGSVTLRGLSETVPPVPAGTTNMGQIVARPGARVLLLADATSPGLTSLVAALTAAGNEVTLRPPPEYTWDNTNPPLAGFECVAHLNGATPFNGFPAPAQQAMMDFIRAGGCYIVSGWMAFEAGGASPLMTDVGFLNYDGGSGGGTATFTRLVDHPVLEGIPNQFTITHEGEEAGTVRVYTADPVEKIMVSSTCGSFSGTGCQGGLNTGGVFVRQLGAGRVIKFTFMAHWNGSAGNPLGDTNVQRLFINAIRWGTSR